MPTLKSQINRHRQATRTFDKIKKTPGRLGPARSPPYLIQEDFKKSKKTPKKTKINPRKLKKEILSLKTNIATIEVTADAPAVIAGCTTTKGTYLRTNT